MQEGGRQWKAIRKSLRPFAYEVYHGWTQEMTIDFDYRSGIDGYEIGWRAWSVPFVRSFAHVEQ